MLAFVRETTRCCFQRADYNPDTGTFENVPPLMLSINAPALNEELNLLYKEHIVETAIPYGTVFGYAYAIGALYVIFFNKSFCLMSGPSCKQMYTYNYRDNYLRSLCGNYFSVYHIHIGAVPIGMRQFERHTYYVNQNLPYIMKMSNGCVLLNGRLYDLSKSNLQTLTDSECGDLSLYKKLWSSDDFGVMKLYDGKLHPFSIRDDGRFKF